jgi:Mn2+/Fe2+ NRAMP family transporter
MLWLALFQYPLMVVIQEICARIGLLTGSGLSAIIRKKYSKRVFMPIVFLLFVANTINVGADINAMSASVNLLLPQIPLHFFSIILTAIIISAIILIPYNFSFLLYSNFNNS